MGKAILSGLVLAVISRTRFTWGWVAGGNKRQPPMPTDYGKQKEDLNPCSLGIA
jgi:hypothetical protein